MPIPEPGLYRPSNLTQKQKQEQLAACYGVPVNEQISASDVEKMRAIVQGYDNQRKKAPIHDLNNPPREPYRFQKFPMMVYNLAQSQPAHEETRSAIVGSSVIEERVHIRAKVVSMVVHSEEDLKAALANGWSKNAPNFADEPEGGLSAKYQREVETIEEQLAGARRRGNPHKEG